MILRNFLFLDTQSLNDYLATLEGYVSAGEAEQTDAGVSRVEGDTTIENTRERKQSIIISDAAKFQQLYQTLERNQAINYIENLDSNATTTLKRNQIVEIQANIDLPKPFLMLRDVENVSPLMEIVKLAGQTIDPQAETAIAGLQSVSKLTADQPIPIICRTISGGRTPFVANLQRQHLRCKANELLGEGTIFAKVQRIVPPRETYEVFSLVPLLTNTMMLNREQRKKAAKEGVNKGFITELKGPVILLTPIAVYR